MTWMSTGRAAIAECCCSSTLSPPTAALGVTRVCMCVFVCRCCARDVRDIPMMPSSTVDDDLVPCPNCGRRFNEKAAERHIPKCADIKAKVRGIVNRRACRTACTVLSCITCVHGRHARAYELLGGSLAMPPAGSVTKLSYRRLLCCDCSTSRRDSWVAPAALG